MIFLLDKKEREKVNKLIETYYYNNDVADYLNKNIIRQVATNEVIDELNILEQDLNLYTSDKYYKNVTPKEVKEGNYKIKYESYKPFECFQYDDINVNSKDYYLINNSLGYFKSKYKYLTIQKDNTTWMSVIPHEINTMKKMAVNLTEHVYVLGLGLGYFPYLVSNKVKKITIIEKDLEIIKLFNKYIFPYFDNKNKYEIINDDAYKYLDKINTTDYIFVDLYHDVNDGLVFFININKKLSRYSNLHFWINNSLIMAFRNIIINLVDEELNKKGLDYTISYNEVDRITNKLHFYLQHKKIDSYESLCELISNNTIIDLIRKI